MAVPQSSPPGPGAGLWVHAAPALRQSVATATVSSRFAETRLAETQQ